MVDKGSSVMDKGSCMMEDRGCAVNNRGSFNKRSSSIVKAIVVSVGKAIVIPKRMRVSNQRVVINKGAVSLAMSSNTAVVVSIGISLTTLTSKVHKWGDFMTVVNNGRSGMSNWSN